MNATSMPLPLTPTKCDVGARKTGCLPLDAEGLPAAGIVVIVTLNPGRTVPTGSASRLFERTATTHAYRVEPTPPETTGQAILEIRRHSGLTWQELAELFEVSRRSVNNWANGKPVAAARERTIRQMLAAIRHLRRAEQRATRALLFSVDPACGWTTFNLLQAGRFDDAMSRVEDPLPLEPKTPPLPRAVREARRLPHPVQFLLAEQDRPIIPANGRPAYAVRVSKPPG